jgi:hypothetical protein
VTFTHLKRMMHISLQKHLQTHRYDEMKTTTTTEFTISLRSPKAAIETIRGLLEWACEDWTQTNSGAAEATIELRIAPGTIDLAALCWVLAHTPGCTTAALTACPTTAFTGSSVRQLQELDAPPSDKMLMRCMDGVVAHLQRQESLRGLLELGTASIQTGLDNNAAVAEGDNEGANYFRSSARVVRGCIAEVLPFRHVEA